MSVILEEDEFFVTLYGAIDMRMHYAGFKWIMQYDHLGKYCEKPDIRAVVRSWRELNHQAFSGRYQEVVVCDYLALNYNNAALGISDLKLYGMLRSLAYQCSEPHTVNNESYKRLQHVYNGMAHYVIQGKAILW